MKKIFLPVLALGISFAFTAPAFSQACPNLGCNAKSTRYQSCLSRQLASDAQCGKKPAATPVAQTPRVKKT